MGVDEYQQMMVGMKDGLFTHNVVAPLLECLHQVIEFLFICVVVDFAFVKSLRVIHY